MKKLAFIFLSFIAIVGFSNPLGIGQVAAALKSGDAGAVAKFFDSKVDLTIGGKSASYTKAQATTALQNFFTANSVKGFTIKHQGDNGGSEYCVGTLVTASGEFRTTFYLNQKANGQNLQEIRFE